VQAESGFDKSWRLWYSRQYSMVLEVRRGLTCRLDEGST